MDFAKYKFPTIEDLHQVGAHFGHSINKWSPKMAPYIFMSKQNIHIVDLEKTVEGIKHACQKLYDVAKSGEQIIFVCTKKQAREYVKEGAVDCGALFVSERWLGGTITNFKILRKNIDKLNSLKKKRESGELEKYTKKERLLIDRDIEKLERFYGGLTALKGIPGALFVVDVKREKTALREANRSDVPVIGVADTNSDPTGVSVVIAANDDSAKSVSKIVSVISEWVKAGYKEFEEQKEIAAAKKASGSTEASSAVRTTTSESPVITDNDIVANKVIAEAVKTLKKPTVKSPSKEIETKAKLKKKPQVSKALDKVAVEDTKDVVKVSKVVKPKKAVKKEKIVKSAKKVPAKKKA